MKIFFYIDYYHPYIGGAEMLWKNLAEGLTKKRIDAIVFTNQFQKDLPAFEKINNVIIHRSSPFFSSVLGRIFWIFISPWKAFYLIKKYQPNIIHTSTFASAIPAWVIGKIFKIKTILQIHEYIGRDFLVNEDNKFLGAASYLLERLILKLKFDKIITVSKYSKDKIEKVTKNNIEVIYNGVDYEHWKPRKKDYNLKNKLGYQKDDFIFLYYGRPGFSKGLELLLSIFLKKELKIDGHLLGLVSKQPEYRFKQIIKNFGFKEQQDTYFKNNVKIINPPVYPILPDYVNLADVVIIPSLSEGFGLSAVESCVLGKNVLCSNKGSLPEVTFGKIIYFNPINQKDFQDKLLLSRQNKFTNIDKKDFNWQTTINQYNKFYQNLLGKKEY